MNAYLYATLQQEAETKGVWIDTQSDGVMRGRDSDNTNKKERVSRALSWYEVSKESDSDSDERLMFSIIAFNALYAQPRMPQNHADSQDSQAQDYENRKAFLGKIFNLQHHYLFDWSSGEIVRLIEIRSFIYLSNIFWRSTSPQKYNLLKEEIAYAREKTSKQIKKKDSEPLEDAIERVYRLRNQLLHGLSAHKDSYNRKQVGLCSEFMFGVVGRTIKTIINDDSEDWGKVPFSPQGKPNDDLFKIKELQD